MHTVAVNRDRPDFRVFIGLLYGDHHNVDTEGDSDPPESRTWTDLYICDRESDDPPVEIFASPEDEGIFEVKSECRRLEELAALYLYDYCGTGISSNGAPLTDGEIAMLRQRYTAELLRAETSVWHEPPGERLWDELETRQIASLKETSIFLRNPLPKLIAKLSPTLCVNAITLVAALTAASTMLIMCRYTKCMSGFSGCGTTLERLYRQIEGRMVVIVFAAIFGWTGYAMTDSRMGRIEKWLTVCSLGFSLAIPIVWLLMKQMNF